MGKIHFVLMGRGIGAMVETKLAVIAFIDNPMMIDRCQLRHVALIDIDSIEQRVKSWAEIEAAATPVAYLINSQRFPFQLRRIDGIDQTKTLHLSTLSS